MEDRNLSLSAVAGTLGVSERTVRRWIQSGKLKAYKPGRDYRIPESALRQLVEESEIASPKDLSPRLPLEERGAPLEDFLKLANDQLEERFLKGEDPKLVVAGLASAVVSLVEWVKPPFEGEAKRLAGLYIRVLAEADPNSKYLPLERKRQVEKFLSTLEETPEESRKA